MEYKKAAMVSDVLAIASVLLALILQGFSERFIWIGIGAVTVLMISAIVIKVVFYRCPHCHRLFPMRTFTTPD